VPIRRQLRLTTFMMVGVAACSMAATFVLLSSLHPAPMAKTSLPVKSAGNNVAAEVRRDQLFASGLDATSGASLVSVANDGPR